MRVPIALFCLVCLAATGCKDIYQKEDNAKCSAISRPVTDQYIVVINKEIAAKTFGAEHNLHAIEFNRKIQQHLSLTDPEVLANYGHTLHGFSAKLNSEKVEQLKQSALVSYVEQDQIVYLYNSCEEIDQAYEETGENEEEEGDSTSSQVAPYGIKRVNGGTEYTGSNTAWILDTGIDLDHPDLNVDISLSFNAFKSGEDSKSLNDLNGHGTLVAGIIAAIDNNEGVIGVAAGARVIPVKVLNHEGKGLYSKIIAGLNHIAKNALTGDVVNISFSGPSSRALDEAVLNLAEKGIQIAIAAGNDRSSADTFSPSRVNGNNIYTISAIDSTDKWADFSNYGNPPIDYAAPGVDILSTWLNGEYKISSGTSLASPHAAGVLLLGDHSSEGNANGDPDGNPDPIIIAAGH